MALGRRTRGSDGYARTWAKTPIAGLIAVLIAIYGVSQFLRNSVGVIASNLAHDLSLSATQIGLVSSAFFLAFAAAQIPVGIAIDRYGPKYTMLASAMICVAGTVLFAAGGSVTLLIAARALMGLGCSTFFMGPLAIYARRFPPERFATLTSLQLGIASLGTLFATAPLASAAGAFGWRLSFAAVALLTAVVAVLVFLVVPGDRVGERRHETWREALGGVGAAMRVPSFWPVYLVHATALTSFSTVIGLWAGPWLSDVHGADLETRGRLLLIGVLAQIAGVFVWGAADRVFRSYRRAVLLAAGLAAGLLFGAAVLPLSLTGAAIWLGLFGFSVAYTPIVTAHGKSLFPPALTGRGITLMNTGVMGGVFLFQLVTGMVVDLAGRTPSGGYAASGYSAVFAVLALGLALSLIPYARAVDPHPSRAGAPAGHG